MGAAPIDAVIQTGRSPGTAIGVADGWSCNRSATTTAVATSVVASRRCSVNDVQPRAVDVEVQVAPDDPEVAGLPALMLLTDARRPARTSADGGFVPLPQQHRSLWNRKLVSEGLQLLASVAAFPDEAASHASTRWAEVANAYGRLESLTGNPMVRLNRAVAVAMVDGPTAGLALLGGSRPA